MKEKFTNESKNNWSRVFKKKWFFPALYLMIAALLLTVVIWYQNLENRISEGLNDIENYSPSPHDDDAKSVLQQKEVIKMPVKDESQAEIVTKFYDYNAEQEDQEKGLILYNNRYYQSTGIDIASSNSESFNVVASLSGTVKEVKEDPLLGNVVVMNHEDDVMTYYASLGEVSVKAGDKINQGDQIGTAGKNIFSQDSGMHVHFELRKNDVEVNPEDYFNQPISKLEQVLNTEDEVKENDNDEAEEEERPSPEDDADDKKDDESTENENISSSVAWMNA